MLKEIQLQELAPSPTNPRKTFDETKLQELARSIGEVGVLEPILVRPHTNGGGVRYEVVAGERRFRAAAIAAVATVPCIVKELTDVEVLELQVIENNQRDDLHPLEEADGYARLMKDAGYDVDQIAQRISKSAKYVYDRIKLLQLIPELRKIFLDGEITAGHAILLARLSSADQKRAMGDGKPMNRYDAGDLGGLFVPDKGDLAPSLELKDKLRRKAASVRELESWINDHVRLKPEEVDLPNLFPETAAALAAAEEEELKVVKISYDHSLRVDARDSEERTFSRPSWKRADGEVDYDESWRGERKPSKTCEHSVLGVVVAGRGRGEAFRVCVNRQKCKVHWAAEIREREKRAKSNGTKPAKAAREDRSAQQRKWEEDRRRRDLEAARWKKAAPKLLEALAAKLQETKPLDLVDAIVKKLERWGPKPKGLERGKTLEDAVRWMAFLVLAQPIQHEYGAAEQVPPTLKPYGIDARKIVDQVAPKEKAEKKSAAAAEKKPGARARRRAKKGGARA